MLRRNYEQEYEKRVKDITGVELTPGEPIACFGNGESGFECCCDACDYYLICFPEFGSKSKEERNAENESDIRTERTKN